MNAKHKILEGAKKKFSFGHSLSKASKIETQNELDSYGYRNKIKREISLKSKLKNHI
jgi:hypothetical protein